MNGRYEEDLIEHYDLLATTHMRYGIVQLSPRKFGLMRTITSSDNNWELIKTFSSWLEAREALKKLGG